MGAIEVLGLGSVLVDELTVLPHFPKTDSKVEIIKSQKQVGGPVPTALKALTKLGLNTSFIGKIGDDTNGAFIQNTLHDLNIDTSVLIKEKGSKSGYAQVWIDSSTSSRTIAYSSGTLNPITTKDLNLENLPEVKLLHIDGRNHEASFEMIEILKKQNSLISIDTGNFREQTLELLNLVDIAMMPKSFAIAFLGDDNLEGLIQKVRILYPQPRLIIITDGENGSACSYQNKIYTPKAFKIDAYDTTGAGDIHNAGIIFGILQNWNIEKTLEFASAFAALKCQHLGNETIAGYEEIINFIERKPSFV